MKLLFNFLQDIILCLLCIFLVIAPGCRSPKEFKTLNVSAGFMQSIDSLCLLHLSEGQFPGLAMAIAQKGNRIWSKGYGYSNTEQKVPVDPKNDLFRIGSISKSITASALARLTEKEVIDLDQPISVYYKNCPADKAGLTLKQLGGHLGCIRHYRGFEFLSNLAYANVAEPLEIFIHDTLLCAPGASYLYSTYGWTLMSAVMEMALQEPFLNIIREEVAVPLKLRDLKPDHRDSTHFKRVTFYDLSDGHHKVSPEVNHSNKWAGGGLLCSAEDLARYGFAHVHSNYLDKKTLMLFTQSQETLEGEKTNYGIGFRSGTDGMGKSWFGHSGGSLGGTSMMLIYPEEELVVITLVNLSRARMNQLAGKIAEIAFRHTR